MSGDITPEKFVEDIDLRRNRVKIYIQRRFDRLAPGRFGLFGGIRIPAMPRKANGLCGSAFKQSGNSNRCDRRRIEAAAQMEADPLRIAQAVFHCGFHKLAQMQRVILWRSQPDTTARPGLPVAPFTNRRAPRHHRVPPGQVADATMPGAFHGDVAARKQSGEHHIIIQPVVHARQSQQ